MDAYTTSSAEKIIVNADGSSQPVFLNPREVEARSTVEIQPISLRDFIGQEMSLVPEVEAVYVSTENRTLHVWIVVDQFDRAVRERVYEREVAIIDEFGTHEFDFNILSLRGRDTHSVIQDPSLDVAFRRMLKNGDQERASK